MALTGAIIVAIGAVLVVVDAVHRLRTTTATIDGGDASTDFAAEEHKAKLFALAATIGATLALVGAVLTVLSL
ncbi:hypothetical protein ACI797_17765 [Geodermatophilus sp. SYSU D00691]